MEEEKIKNTVTLTLEDYMNLYEKSKLSNKVTETIVNIVLNSCELNSKKDGLNLDSYDLRSNKILSVIKEYFNEDYEKTVKELKEMED